MKLVIKYKSVPILLFLLTGCCSEVSEDLDRTNHNGGAYYGHAGDMDGSNTGFGR